MNTGSFFPKNPTPAQLNKQKFNINKNPMQPIEFNDVNKPIIKIRNFGNAFTNFKTRNKRNNRNAVIIPPPPFPEVGNGTNDIKTIIKSKR